MIYIVILPFFAESIQAYQTQNVIIVTMNGVRYSESFGNPQYIPNIWNNLRSQGTIYTQFYNDFLATYTNPSNLAILTGQWHLEPNYYNEGKYNDTRSPVPLIFEYYRKARGVPETACWMISNKRHNGQSDWSLEPSFGPNYKSSVRIMVDANGTRIPDEQTYDELASIMQTYQPGLLMVDFGDADETAQQIGNFNLYTQEIQQVDQLIYQIWTNLIQGDSFYRDRTTLIVTSGNGRNGDSFGGFVNNSGIDEANRHVLFLAIGPDTPANQVINDRRYLIDIAPTVGELLGFPAPFARGQVLTGIFTTPPNSTPRTYQQDPQVTIYNQNVFVAWSQNVTGDTGTQRIYLTKKQFSQSNFDPPILVNCDGTPSSACNATNARWAFFPSITADPQGLHVVWLDGRALDSNGDTWSIFYRKSPNYGATWDAEKLIATSIFESATNGGIAELVGEPEISSNSQGELIITVRYKTSVNGPRNIKSFRSTDGGQTWTERTVHTAFGTLPRQFMVQTMSQPKEIIAVWSDLAEVQPGSGQYNWEIFSKRSLNGANSWESSSFKRLTSETGYSYMPRVAWSDRVLAVWVNRDLSDNIWKLQTRISTTKGANWGNVITIPKGANTSVWQPALVWDSVKTKFYLISANFNISAGVLDLTSNTSPDGQSWTDPSSITAPPVGIRSKPNIAFGNGQKYIVWEEQNSDGSWSIQTFNLN
jgi:hypothetical protein